MRDSPPHRRCRSPAVVSGSWRDEQSRIQRNYERRSRQSVPGCATIRGPHPLGPNSPPPSVPPRALLPPPHPVTPSRSASHRSWRSSASKARGTPGAHRRMSSKPTHAPGSYSPLACSTSTPRWPTVRCPPPAAEPPKLPTGSPSPAPRSNDCDRVTTRTVPPVMNWWSKVQALDNRADEDWCWRTHS